MKALRLFVAVMLLTISSACVLSAQDNSPVNKSYIYCTVAFDSFKVEKEKQVHSYTQKYTERMFKMKIDCRQYDSDLNSFFGIINDENGKPREFVSQIAGINWLGLMGWEIITYPIQYKPEYIVETTYWLRMDVSGLSHDEINKKLSVIFL